MLYLHHHLGLGDHIICNGLVRTLVESKGEVTLFVKQHNRKLIERMYDNDSRIGFVDIPTEAWKAHPYEIGFVDDYIRSCTGDFLRLGFGQNSHMNFDEAFYACAGVPMSNRWDKFSLRRDLEQEKRILDKLNPTGEPYIFVHDDPSRGIFFDPPNPRGLTVVRNDVSESIFDMIGVFENADEIHCMESSIRCLIESLPSVDCPLYLNTKVRHHAPNTISMARKLWRSSYES